MHHDVGAAACGLIIRQSHGKIRVHDSELGTAEIGVIATLLHALFLGDNGRITHLAAGCRQSEDDADGEAGLRLTLLRIEVPDIAFVGNAITHGLGRIDGTSAADGEDEVNAFLLAELDAFVDQAKTGIGNRAAEAYIGDSSRIQGIRHLLHEAGTDHAATAIMDQNLLTTEFFN